MTYKLSPELEEVLQEEIDFFKKIKNECEIIFDVGCREDISYIEASDGKTFHMFEPNVEFFHNCEKKIINISNNKIYLNNFGLSNKTGMMDYWTEYQSFFCRPHQLPFFHKHNVVSLPVKKLSEYVIEKNIEKIDFLKIDTEGSEPDILLDYIDFLKKNTKYIQFEYGNTWIDRGDNISLGDITSSFESDFTFYILCNEHHPISESVHYSHLAEIGNIQLLGLIEDYIRKSVGFNIIMINKKEKHINE